MTSIGSILCDIRKKKGFTRKDVAEKLKAMGIEISDKTLYGYESGRTTANADMFLALCKIYDIDDIFTTFGYNGFNKDGSLMLNMYEIEHIQKYRALDTYGHKAVDSILDIEYDRCQLDDITIAQQERSSSSAVQHKDASARNAERISKLLGDEEKEDAGALSDL